MLRYAQSEKKKKFVSAHCLKNKVLDSLCRVKQYLKTCRCQTINILTQRNYYNREKAPPGWKNAFILAHIKSLFFLPRAIRKEIIAYMACFQVLREPIESLCAHDFAVSGLQCPQSCLKKNKMLDDIWSYWGWNFIILRLLDRLQPYRIVILETTLNTPKKELLFSIYSLKGSNVLSPTEISTASSGLDSFARRQILERVKR